MDPLPHQERNIDSLITSLGTFGSALDASDTGTGKTYTALFLAKKLQAKVAVVCPLACIHSWRKACEAVGVEPLFIANYEQCKSKYFKFGVAEKSNGGNHPKYIWNITEERLIFIFDEVHRCRAPGTMNSKMLAAASAKWKTLMLSATPFTTPLEARPIGMALKLFTGGTYYSWMMKYGVRKNYFQRWEFQGDHTDIAKIHDLIFPLRGVRTRHDEIAGFPETIIQAEAVETGETNAIQNIYIDALAGKILEEQENAAELEMDVLPITKALRERQLTELYKCKIMADMAQDSVAKGNSVALFVNFDASIEVLRNILKVDCVIRGNRKGENNYTKYNAVDAFSKNREPIIIVNSAAGGAGISLHDETGGKKPRESFISPPWSALVLKQVLGRPHRHGGGFSRQRLVFASGTIEETRVMPRVQSRLDNLDALVDGDLDFLESNVTV